MPRFHYNTSDQPSDRISEGLEFGNPEEARSVAVKAAGEHLKDIDGQFWNGPEWRLHVTDEDGHPVCTLVVQGWTEGDGSQASQAEAFKGTSQ